MIMFFKKRSNKETKEGIELGVNYFVNGPDVVFDLNGLDFTFEKFYVNVNEDNLTLIIPEEVPMNLINLLDSLKDDLDADRSTIIEADIVSFNLELNNDVFTSIKSKIHNASDIKDLFNIEIGGKTPLKFFKNYELVRYDISQGF
jgi:hypothetical protein